MDDMPRKTQEGEVFISSNREKVEWKLLSVVPEENVFQNLVYGSWRKIIYVS